MTSLAFVFTVAAALVAAAVVAGVCVFWLTEQPWVFTLGPAIGLVWFDSPVRHALLPSAAGLGLWGRIGVTLAAWLVLLYVVLIFLWSDPEFAQAAVALALVVGFTGADAPASRWLRGHLTWRLWGFPVDHPVIAACDWFTVVFLLQLLWRAPRRPPILGQRDLRDTSSGLRQDLRGYTLVGVHVVIAAGAALALPRTAGAVRVSTAGDDRRTQATQALTAAARYVAGSLPGPDVPKILDWRVTTDFAGPWAGLVIVLAVAAVVLFVLFPLTRTVLLWARLAVGRPRPGQALAEIPAVVAANLAVVVDFLSAAANQPERYEVSVRRVRLGNRQVILSGPVAAAERRLVQAALDMPRLLDLFGEESTPYRTADKALSSTTEAYRAYHKAFGPASSRFTQIEPKIAAARAAVDEFTDTVERWQTAWHNTPAQGTPNGPPKAT